MVGSGSGISKQNLLIAFIKKRGRIRDPVLFYPPDPGSGSGIKHPGSATLLEAGIMKFFRNCILLLVGKGW
jgi:hypothetical protein